MNDPNATDDDGLLEGLEAEFVELMGKADSTQGSYTMRDTAHSACRFTLIGAALAAGLAASAGAQAWDSRTQFYSEGGAYLGEARTRHNPGIDASIPLQVRPMDPNGFINAFERGLELRELEEELDYYQEEE
jgi:hypothetical protein